MRGWAAVKTPSASQSLGTFAAEPGEEWIHPLRLAEPRHLPRGAGGGVGHPLRLAEPRHLPRGAGGGVSNPSASQSLGTSPAEPGEE